MQILEGFEEFERERGRACAAGLNRLRCAKDDILGFTGRQERGTGVAAGECCFPKDPIIKVRKWNLD